MVRMMPFDAGSGASSRLVVEDDVVLMPPYALKVGKGLIVHKLSGEESEFLRRLGGQTRIDAPVEDSGAWKGLLDRELVRLAAIPPVSTETVDLSMRVDAAIAAGVLHLLRIQDDSGSFGRTKLVAVWDTANALLALAAHRETVDMTAAGRALTFLARQQSREGWFDMEPGGSHFCTETTATCGAAFLRWGRPDLAGRVADFLDHRSVIQEVFSMSGMSMRHVYPSVIGYLANFFIAQAGTLPSHVSRELERVAAESPTWRAHAFYYHTPLYYYKELIPLMTTRGIKDRVPLLLDRMHRSQNLDLGFGYCESREVSAPLPTAMAVRAAVAAVEDDDDLRRVAGMVERLVDMQGPDGGWSEESGTLVGPQPDEFTTVSGVPGLWPAIVLLLRRRLLPLPPSWPAVFGDKRFPRRLFFPCAVESYCTSAFPTSQALLALADWKATGTPARDPRRS